MPNGDLKYNLWTHSHEDLIRFFGLKDTAGIRGEPRFARVEFCPEDTRDMDDLDKYALIIDEALRPEWFDDKTEKSVVDRLKIIVSGIIISGEADLLCGGVFILARGAKISCVKNCTILVMCDSSTVGEMRDSSKVGEMRGLSTVGEMRG
ncbi:MAG: hypothetical protein KGL39_49925, partial [Patescibacteria group bacterium]|nr:hypothetical protein [Patescibacteria group bacterium]